MTDNDLNAAAVSRPLALTMQRGLVIVAQPARQGMRYTVKDPVSQHLWRLCEEELFLLRLLDGKASIADLRRQFERKFSPRRLDPTELVQFLARLHREGLIIGDQPGQTAAVLQRQREWRRAAPLRLLYQLVAWRFRGVDPDRWLARIAPRLSGIFSWWAAACFFALFASAALLAAVHWRQFDRELTALAASITADQVLLVLVTIGVTKVLHELGHAIACKHFGGECHEIGLLLLCGVPALYCNVSDAWLLPAKRPRILISAAGILVELIIAAACTWLWWCTYPGLIHSLALYAIVVCSVNTVLLNGNPLLQYDGYFILADLTDTPNLRARSSNSARSLFARLLLGLNIPGELVKHGRAFWLIAYAIASAIYRWILVIGMTWLLHGMLKPYGAEFVGWLIGGILAGTLLIEPIMGIARFLRRPDWNRQIPWRIVAPRNAILAFGCLALAIVPLPASVVAPVVLEPRGAHTVYVEVEGRLAWAISSGARVKEGDPLIRLDSLPLKLELTRFLGERDIKRQELTSLLRRQSDPEAAAKIPAAEKALADLNKRLGQLQCDFERLVIRAPCDGVVLPPPPRRSGGEPVPEWTGTPLDRENLGCHLQTGAVVCLIGRPQAMDALAMIAQGNEDLVQSGQQVQLLISGAPCERLAGEVTAPPDTRVRQAPEELVAQGELPIERDAGGQPRPNQSMFVARIAIASLNEPLFTGATGRAKISIAPRSILCRAWRALSQTLRYP
jgi:putative peptide zinc metalloprotease protein